MLNNLCRVALVAILILAIASHARAESLQAAGDQIVIGIVVVTAAVAVTVTLLILHQKHKKSSITGCVSSGAGGMVVTDEKDKRIYSLAGDPPGAKPGDRMTLEGRRNQRGTTPVFEARSVIRDFGACQP